MFVACAFVLFHSDMSDVSAVSSMGGNGGNGCERDGEVGVSTIARAGADSDIAECACIACQRDVCPVAVAVDVAAFVAVEAGVTAATAFLP